MKIYETVSKMVDISSQRIMISESQETSELDNCFTYGLISTCRSGNCLKGRKETQEGVTNNGAQHRHETKTNACSYHQTGRPQDLQALRKRHRKALSQ